MRQPITDDAADEAAEGTRQERRSWSRARAGPQHAHTHEHGDHNADEGPHEIGHSSPLFGQSIERAVTKHYRRQISAILSICLRRWRAASIDKHKPTPVQPGLPIAQAHYSQLI